MDRNYDEVISEMLMQLEQIDASLKKQNDRMTSFDKRTELTVKRLVKAERRMEEFDKKLELSIKDLRAQSQLQSKANAYFLKQLTKQAKVLETILKRNGKH